MSRGRVVADVKNTIEEQAGAGWQHWGSKDSQQQRVSPCCPGATGGFLRPFHGSLLHICLSLVPVSQQMPVLFGQGSVPPHACHFRRGVWLHGAAHSENISSATGEIKAGTPKGVWGLLPSPGGDVQ